MIAMLTISMMLFLAGGCMGQEGSRSHGRQTAEMTITESGPAVRGMKLASYNAEQIRVVSGPKEGILGIEGNGNLAVIDARLDRALGERGSIMFWFRTDREYKNGMGVEEFEQGLVDVNGMFKTLFDRRSSSINLFLNWQDSKQDRDMQVIMPGLDGPGWVHMAFTWDRDSNDFNCYINGTPCRIPGTKIAGLNTGSGDLVRIYLGRFAIAGLVISHEPFDAGRLKEFVPAASWGRFDAMLGAKDLGMVNLEKRKGRLAYSNPMAEANDLKGWVMEGPGVVKFENWWTVMEAKEPEGPILTGHWTYWCDRDFDANFVAEWDIEVLSEHHFGITFFSAKGKNGEDIFDPALAERDGMFRKYTHGDINCYHISYYANAPYNAGRPTSNLRKNAGFYLVSNGPIGISHTSRDVHKAMLMKDGSRIVFAVDGRKIIEYTDDGRIYGPVLGGGKMGFRQMRWTKAKYRNFRVYEVMPEQGR